MEYRAYNAKSFKKIPQVQQFLSSEDIENIEIAALVFPFKVNNYLIDKLINWENYQNDPIFRLVFPHKDMLLPQDFERLKTLYKKGDQKALNKAIYEIRMRMNPHPADQKSNVPTINGKELTGSQHKYKETILFFPKQGQTCHAYCSFCFRWPQFTGINELKFAMKEVDLLIEYIKAHPSITDLIFTGGDPLIMSTKLLRSYIEPILNAKIPHLQNIRFGTKTLGFWPYRFLTDSDADDLLKLFEEIVVHGYHLAFMAHFNHYRELETDEVKEAVKRIQQTGAIIRTQAPILRHINDSSKVWQTMWKMQVKMGMIPYYMFIARDTGAQHYFGVPLVKAWQIYKDALSNVSGLGRTVRGPSMSAAPGKIAVSGVSEINGEKVIVLNMLQAKNPALVDIPFFARYDENAQWIDELKPAFSEKFLFEKK
ncbi:MULTISPECIES: KamA family radical SAM protein [unclassified Nitratiruptor]|uniref:KamA family radical SAM protein n=1 Tax=unclassified Nitratiruptor TaxID=2624044 RepID=UPI0019156351|nr:MULTISPECIES: 4Fe-4S cluster-binding domain-containing protein [unclassified Nitratiruptor]BCD60364.1 lysine 2,3-aminomutase [Nitratiruptor sp. YY08-10]BCD64147.1 lysine 2,3-aminomutase [Nitratiruptor sp. YY08-14]